MFGRRKEGAYFVFLIPTKQERDGRRHRHRFSTCAVSSRRSVDRPSFRRHGATRPIGPAREGEARRGVVVPRPTKARPSVSLDGDRNPVGRHHLLRRDGAGGNVAIASWYIFLRAEDGSRERCDKEEWRWAAI